MAADQIGGVVEDVSRQSIDSILRYIVTGQDHSAHSHGGHILVLTVVGTGGDDVLGVVRRGGQQLVDMGVIQRHQISSLGSGQIHDSGGGGAGHDEGGVDLAVLQGVSAVAKALIGGVDLGELAVSVQIAQAISAQDVHSVEVHTGTGSADRHVLTGQVSHGLDAGIGGDDLHIFHVQGGHGGEAVDGALKEVGAVIGIGHHVGLAEGQLCVAVCQLFHVGLRAVANQTGDRHIGIVGGVLGDNGAEGIVGAGLAAGDEAQLRGRSSGSAVASLIAGGVTAAAGSQRSDEAQSQNQRKHFFHSKSLFHS